ncbi:MULTISPECIES: ECF transporter S component [unclassified Aminobacter]|uniref:ECF transporter S component n=1 Tax=unclassified Aminobacter TaxID=2644704 RepID=UPI0004634C0F|nr:MULTISPECIES: ECF transporter S component [unclassified Aminobacter]TWH31345.1 energy-coupling factor transport system substrate-specific component [Aminobacter sp. J15]
MASSTTRLFETRVLSLIAVAIVINIVGNQINDLVRLPIFLDSIGTVLVGVLAGPLAGGVTGLLTNLILGLIVSPVAAAFAPVAIVIGVVAGLMARAGWFRTWWQAAVTGVVIAAALTLVAVPIRIYMFGGVTGSGADFIVGYLSSVGQTLFSSVALTVFGTNVADKVITALIVWALVRQLPQRLTAGYGHLQYSRA